MGAWSRKVAYLYPVEGMDSGSWAAAAFSPGGFTSNWGLDNLKPTPRKQCVLCECLAGNPLGLV